MFDDVRPLCQHPAMFYDTLISESRKGDPLDAVRLAALDRMRPLVGLMERHRNAVRDTRRWRSHEEYELLLARAESAQEEIGRYLSARTEEESRAAALCLLLAARFDSVNFWRYPHELRTAVSGGCHWTPGEVAVMLDRATEVDRDLWFVESLKTVLDAAEQLDSDGLRAVAPALRHVESVLRDARYDARSRASLSRRLLALLATVDEARIPEGLIPRGEPWAEPLHTRVGAEPTAELASFVRHLVSLQKPRPSQKWARTCLELTDGASARDLVAGMLRVLAEGEPLCSRVHGRPTDWASDAYHSHYLVHQRDADLARGAVWAAALAHGPAAVPLLRALALRAGVRGTDVWEDAKLAGAAVNALAEIGDQAALEALWQIRARVRDRALQKQVATALVTAAGKLGITPQQLVERSVPDHGLAPGGSVERELGEYRARLVIENASTVRLLFVRPDGSTTRTAPTAVKDGCPDALKELKNLAKEVRRTLSGERARVEALMSADRLWTYDEWCRHYLDHPVTGVVARELIWEFEDSDGTWHAALPADRPASAGQLPGEPRRVRLWHPIRASVDEIRRWRSRLVEEQLRQPFKQAFRETYLLTPAEEGTGLYSNRFAAHIVEYLRLYALFKERGWQANFLGRHEGGYEGTARGEFGDGEWRACFHHEPAADDDGYDYAPDHAVTDQVRFERRHGRRWREVPLAEVPPQVFSEAMRDVDLFVGVTSIAGDPAWTDRGENRYTDYWRAAGFGKLTETAEALRDALRRILPRLKIADRCALDGRFLTVRGDLRTYRIHLGSANILMEPDDSYLCVVPARRRSTGTLYLPFEDDRLSLILSKAFLLAADTKITDMSILAQIRRGG